MDNDKNNLEVLFQYGHRILAELKGEAVKKSADLETLKRRHENLRQNLKNLLETQND